MTQQELELPKGWVETKLEDIAIQLQSGGTPSTKKPEYYKNGTIPFVKIDDITDSNTKYLETTKIKITKQQKKFSFLTFPFDLTQFKASQLHVAGHARAASSS